MKGAIIGDIIGSIYEFDNYKGEPNDFELLTPINFYTDDTICTCGIAKALLEKDNPSPTDYARNLWNFCNKIDKLSEFFAYKIIPDVFLSNL